MSTRPLNRNQLKYLVILAMLIDHIAWAFFPLESVPGQILHFIGRLTGATMAYFLAEGYFHTRNVRNYALRLGIFALLSWPPYSYFETGQWFSMQFGVIYTLFLGLMGILLWEKTNLPKAVKKLGILVLCMLSLFGDWPVFDILWPLGLVIFHNDERKKWRFFFCFCAITSISMMAIQMNQPWWSRLWCLGIMLPPVLLRFAYNGQPGSRHPFHKWFFYVFYPLHLLLLACFQFYGI